MSKWTLGFLTLGDSEIHLQLEEQNPKPYKSCIYIEQYMAIMVFSNRTTHYKQNISNLTEELKYKPGALAHP